MSDDFTPEEARVAYVHLVDQMVAEHACDMARVCLSTMTCALEPELQPLLEGVLEEHGKSSKTPVVSRSMHALLKLEAELTQQCLQIEPAEGRDLALQSAPAGGGGDAGGARLKPSVDTLTCMNCSMPVAANRFAPHLERCMLGKGRPRRGAGTSA